jgi:hypothetical protein
MTKSDQIRVLKKARPDLKNIEIARIIGCSPPNVTQALSLIPVVARNAHHCLAPDEMAFLAKEAKAHNLSEKQMVVALLRDAISDAMECA